MASRADIYIPRRNRKYVLDILDIINRISDLEIDRTIIDDYIK
jgi:hypothetical protein